MKKIVNATKREQQTEPMSVDGRCCNRRCPFVVNFVDALIEEAMMHEAMRVVKSELINDSHDEEIKKEFFERRRRSYIWKTSETQPETVKKISHRNAYNGLVEQTPERRFEEFFLVKRDVRFRLCFELAKKTRFVCYVHDNESAANCPVQKRCVNGSCPNSEIVQVITFNKNSWSNDLMVKVLMFFLLPKKSIILFQKFAQKFSVLVNH